MQDFDAAITREEAEIMFKQPKDNILKIGKATNTKMLPIMIKNYLMHFEKVEVLAVSSSIGLTLNAVKILQDEEYLVIEKLATDLIGDEKFKPSVSLTIMRKKR